MFKGLTALATVVATVLLLSCWALSSPQGSSPDDDFHLGSIWCAEGFQDGRCEWRREPKDGMQVVGVPAYVGFANCYAYDSWVSASCTKGRGSEIVESRGNAGLYPTLYYRTMSPFVGGDAERSVVRMRLANLLVFTLLAAAAVALAGPALRRALTLTYAATMVPLGLFVVTSINPSGWTITGMSTYWGFLLTFLTHPSGARSWRRWLAGSLAVVSAAIVLASRTDGAAYLVLTSGAVTLITLTRPRDLIRWTTLLPAVIALVALAKFLTAHSSKFVSGMPIEVVDDPSRHGLQLFALNLQHLPALYGGMFGEQWGLGWLDTLMPVGVGVSGCAIVFALMILSAGSYWRTKTVAVGTLALALVAMPLIITQQSFAKPGEVVQPRYLLPLAIVVIGLALLTREGDDRRSWRIPPQALVVMVLCASLANSMALRTNLKRYLTGIEDPVLNLNRHVEWWWSFPMVPPMTVWIVGTLAGLLIFASLAWLALVAQTRLAVPSSAALDRPASA